MFNVQRLLSRDKKLDGVIDAMQPGGSGNPFSYAFNGNHTYAQGGSFNVTVSVTDKDGGTGASNASECADRGDGCQSR